VRKLLLADLTGFGLSRLGLTRADLLESGPNRYGETAEFAEKVHQNRHDVVDGIFWISRQFDLGRCIVLFGDRVTAMDLSVVNPPLPIDSGKGWEQINEIADKANITITTP
jgi:hypothetical protein